MDHGYPWNWNKKPPKEALCSEIRQTAVLAGHLCKTDSTGERGKCRRARLSLLRKCKRRRQRGWVGFVSQLHLHCFQWLHITVHYLGTRNLLEQSRAGRQPEPTYRFPPFSFLQKKAGHTGRELLLTWLRGNWKSWLSYETHILKWRTVGEESGALWGGLWLRKKDFSTCVVHLSFCSISCCHGKPLFSLACLVSAWHKLKPLFICFMIWLHPSYIGHWWFYVR